MKVVLVNHSDTLGGASVVTYRLMMALVAQGIDARMLVMTKNTDSLRVEQLEPAWRRKACFLREHAQIFLHNGLNRDNLFKVSIATCGMPISEHPWVVDADYVMLNWVNQGMISLREISRIKAPVIWTMHDTWCLTGVCHYNATCQRFIEQCGHCPLLHGGTSDNDLSRKTWRRKQHLYAAKRITFVAVSNWLGDLSRQSSLLAHQDVRVIPNAFPTEEYYTTPRRSRRELGLPDGRLVVMAAARLDVPIKGLPLAIEALNKASELLSADGREPQLTMVLAGALRNEHALDGLRVPHVYLGMTDEDKLRDVYAHADVVISSSYDENLPGTLIEGMAAGCVPVTFDRGGQGDIVDHLSTGYIAKLPDTDDLARGVVWALARHDELRETDYQLLRQTVYQRFSADSVARRYIELMTKND